MEMTDQISEDLDEDTLQRAYAKAHVALEEAICAAGGDYRNIDFEAIRRAWLRGLTVQERVAIEDDEESFRQRGGFDRMPAELPRYLRRLGCWNPPQPNWLN